MTSLLSHSVTGVTLTSVSLLTLCSCEDLRLDRRLDLRELCLPYPGCRPTDTSGITMNRPSTSSRRGTSFSSFFCRLRWARLQTNHNNHTQVSKTFNQSQQSHSGKWDWQPITTITLRWARLQTNHNNHTQVSKTFNQSQQSHSGEQDFQPITTITLGWARLSTNHNNHTQVSKTVNQSQQSHSGKQNCKPITTITLR